MLALMLSAAWVASIACADVQARPVMHHHMPCCPPDAGTQGCSTAQCERAPEKTEAQSGEQVATLPVADAVPSD